MRRATLLSAVLSTALITPVNSYAMNATLCKAMTNKVERERCLMRYTNSQELQESAKERREQKAATARQKQLKAQAELTKAHPTHKVPNVLNTGIGFIEFEILNVRLRGHKVCSYYDYQQNLLHQERLLLKPGESRYSAKTGPRTYPYRVRCSD